MLNLFGVSLLSLLQHGINNHGYGEFEIVVGIYIQSWIWGI
jgi:hypothetical protein